MHEVDEAIEAVELVDGNAPPAGPMTEDEFVAWCVEDMKAEWVDGEVIVMSPSSLGHVRIEVFLVRLIGDFVEHHDLGEILGPEFTIRLAARRRRRVPDLLFLAKGLQDLLRRNHLEGAPDLAIEIVSPESVSRDWRDKYLDYQAAGVREYWVIDPHSERVEANALGADGAYVRIAEVEGRIPSAVLPGFFLRPSWLWQADLPRVQDVLRELGVPR